MVYNLTLHSNTIYLFEPFDDVITDFEAKILNGFGLFEVACDAILVVRSKTVIATSLDVECCQIETGEGNVLLFEQVVGNFSRHELVQIFHRSGHQSSHHLSNDKKPLFYKL